MPTPFPIGILEPKRLLFKREGGFLVQNSSLSPGGETCGWIGRVEFLLKEIQKAERTEKELWDFIEHENTASQATIIGEGVALDHTPLKPAGDAA